MTAEEGRGLQVMKRLLNGALERLPRADAAAFIDTLERDELAVLLESLSAAGVANGTGGNLFYEAAAKHLREPVKAEQCDSTTVDCARPLGHNGPCCIYPVVGERKVA